MAPSMVVFLFAALSATRAQKFGNCGQKSVTPVSQFNIEEFADNTWSYEYFPEDSFYNNIDSAILVLRKPDPLSCAFSATMTTCRSNGTKEYLRLQDNYLGKGKRYETLLDKNGKLTNTHYQVVFYGNTVNPYAQFYVCKYNGDSGGLVDFRYVLVRSGYTLTKKDIAKIKYNDDKQRFSGRLVRRAGTSYNNSDSSSSDSH